MQLLEVNGQLTMSSLEMVEYINAERGDGVSQLRHDNFMPKVVEVLKNDAPKFLGTQIYGNNNTRSIYNFPKREACLMAMSYSYDLQAKIFDRWQELEAKQKPLSELEFAERYLATVKAKIEAEQALMIAVATKAEIGNRREATAMNTASQAVKKADKLQIELDKSKEYSTVKRMQLLHHGQRFDWRLLKQTAADMDVSAIDVFDQNYGSVKAYHADVWREAYALSICGF